MPGSVFAFLNGFGQQGWADMSIMNIIMSIVNADMTIIMNTIMTMNVVDMIIIMNMNTNQIPYR